MATGPFLAMTAAEIFGNSRLPEQIAWMACHFSPYGLGLSNLPRQLPAGSLLILDDITPIRSHDPQIILDQLTQCAQQFSCSGILLDFQRPGSEEAAALVQFLSETLPCPMAVSHFYGDVGSFPVFLPPVPLSEPLQAYLGPWKDRKIWLELALDGMEITVTEKGSTCLPLPHPDRYNDGFYDEDLCCHYRCIQQEENVKFLLWRTEEDLKNLMEAARKSGISKTLGLYQELHSLVLK